MQRIAQAIQTSGYSIHDLSRCRGEGDANLARFNMPLELGMAMAERFRRGYRRHYHDWLVLVPKGHAYSQFASDLAGYDPVRYDGTAISVVPAVMAWLATRRNAAPAPPPRSVIEALATFEAERAILAADWGGHETWGALLALAERVAREAALIEQAVA